MTNRVERKMYQASCHHVRHFERRGARARRRTSYWSRVFLRWAQKSNIRLEFI